MPQSENRFEKPQVAIVDYLVGNMFSVKQACEYVGMNAFFTNDAKELSSADLVILPGVGAFGDAMEALKKWDLIETIQEIAQSGKPLVGICLGMQLLMSRSEEFGNHQGLNLIPGDVKRFNNEEREGFTFKVPQVGWNRVVQPEMNSRKDFWSASPFDGIVSGDFFYFVHSYFVVPEKKEHVLSETCYGSHTFASSIRCNNIYGFQFHPERSGKTGLQLYHNFKSLVTQEPITIVKS